MVRSTGSYNAHAESVYIGWYDYDVAYVRRWFGYSFHDGPIVVECDTTENILAWHTFILPNNILYVHMKSWWRPLNSKVSKALSRLTWLDMPHSRLSRRFWAYRIRSKQVIYTNTCSRYFAFRSSYERNGYALNTCWLRQQNCISLKQTW